MNLLRSFLTYAFFPSWFVGSQVVAVVAYRAGVAGPLVVLGISATTVLAIAIAERVHPEFPDWNRPRGDVRTDLTHAIVSMALVPQLLGVGLPALWLGASSALAERFGGGLWPASWPIGLQLALALFVSQLGEYWVHRLGHEVPLLWRFHATHHSPERLYWLNAARFHPLDSAASFSVSMSSLLLLGAGPEVLMLFTVWVAVHGLFQHCNVHLRLGPLNYVFSMAELHRWHHSLVLREANANYGNNILLWDLIFGTVFWPRDRDARERIGITDPPDFPRDYLGQLLSPIRWRALTAATPASSAEPSALPAEP